MAEERWIDVLAVDDVPVDDAIGITPGGVDMALYRVDGKVFATGNVCTHGAARLCDGFLDGYTIECPLHQGRFDIRSGQALSEPAVDPLPTYAVRIEGKRVYVKVE